jgi:hypothetical protein
MNYTSKKTIMPFVVLYEGVFDNAPEILHMLKESEASRVLLEWEPWYELGQRTRLEPITESNLSEVEQKQLKMHDMIYGNLIEAYKDYVLYWTNEDTIEYYVNPNRSLHEDWKYVFGEIVTDWESFDKIPDNPD